MVVLVCPINVAWLIIQVIHNMTTFNLASLFIGTIGWLSCLFVLILLIVSDFNGRI